MPRRRRWLTRSRHVAGLYLLMLPTIVSLAIFGYYPKIDVLVKSLYRWTPGTIQEYVGVRNFLDAFGDPLFWQSFKVVMIMLLANLVKMWPSIIVAVALHRLFSDKLRYGFQVLFVIPMVIPMMVWLLIWKSFFDPDLGVLNQALNATGLMHVLAWLDGTDVSPGVMPQIASLLEPIQSGVIGPLFGSVWGLVLVGVVLLTLSVQPRDHGARLAGYGLLAATPLLSLLALPLLQLGGAGLVTLLVLLVVWNVAIAFTLKAGWVIWPFVMIYALWAAMEHPWRATLLLSVGFALGELVRSRFDLMTSGDLLRRSGMTIVVAGALVVGFGMIWTEPTNQFVTGAPAWLGSEDLVLPALILWGFPWVGTVGVLIYLAGLQQISNDIYEAAELDGIGPVGKLFRIELPLIMTQVRINLIFMTIGTLTSYEFFLILLGRDGGPGNVGMVPGLYMYRSAFIEGRYGYACALGMVMFVIILLLTIIYQKYVKVEK
ncbi:MAG: ABC transporter permease subunit [Planctomycetota bacterium]